MIVALAVSLFMALHVLGDPVSLMLPEDATSEQVAAARHLYGYDRPFLVQLGDFMGHLVRLDFGDSLRYRTSAGKLFQQRFPRTVALAGVVFVIAFPLGLVLGILAALRPLSLLDRFINLIAFATVAVPSFWLGLMLMVIFSVQLRLLPTSGFDGFTSWQYYILPGVTLAARPIGRLAQLSRSSVMEEMSKCYITAARAKGLSEARVVFVHALKNAMNPVITLGGAELRMFLGGSLVIEAIFGWPGVGSLLIDSIMARDLYVVETCIMAIGVIVIFINLGVDLLYAWFDPRIVYK
jgi:peptide/nickel transport system permease protein